MVNIEFISGGAELLDEIQPLWEKLNQHHEEISSHFSADFRVYKFAERKANLLKKYIDGQLRVELAQSQGQTVGYLVGAVTKDGVGEIESIFIATEFRGQGIADELMKLGLSWLDSQGAHTKLIAVAVGNERAYSFYARFGFYPRVVMLKQKDKARTTLRVENQIDG